MHPKLLFCLLSLSLCAGASTLALDIPATTPARTDPVEEASRRIALETAAGIKALGPNPASNQIASIVFKAVRASPDSVLRVVDAAVRVSPLSAISGIVTAATAAVPNRWKQVTYRRLAAQAARRSAADDNIGPQLPGLSIGLSEHRSSGPATGGTDANSANGIPMTLAEAIARTAFDAEPSLSFSEVQAAVNAALLADAAKLLRNLEDPRGTAATGGSGLSTYANEPLVTPKQPVVSR